MNANCSEPGAKSSSVEKCRKWMGPWSNAYLQCSSQPSRHHLEAHGRGMVTMLTSAQWWIGREGMGMTSSMHVSSKAYQDVWGCG
jgi:hypothetical protein